MARTKNATVVPTEHEADPVLGEEEEELPREDPGKEPEDYEEAEQNSMDSEDETEPLRPLKMYFSPSDYVKPFKLSSKCYIHQAVKLLRGHLSVDELKWFLEHPQFKHFFHMHTGSNHKLMGMWMLLLRTACLDKKKECWFVVNGVPIRYSIQEFALSSGLFCHSYPKNYEAIGSDRFSGKHFGSTGIVTYARVKDKLLSMKRSNHDRLKMVVLYLLCSVIVGKRKTGPQAEPVEDLFLRAVEDLEWCKTFPWGRFAFEHNMKDIFHLLDHFDGGLGAQWVFPSFVMPLEILAFEAIPNLMNQFREHVVSADPLGTTKEIESIMLPNPSENELLRRIMNNEDGSDDFDDVIVNGWTRRIFKVHKQVCFEELHNIDVGNRVMEESQEEVSLELGAEET